VVHVIVLCREWHVIRVIVLCREWHVVHVIVLSQTSSCITVGKE
jgi:hypothetical protein